MEDLLGEFGERWKVCYEKYADGYQLEAVPRPPDPEGPKVTAPSNSVALLRDRLREHEGAVRP